jgi:hypothetical protein
MPTRFDQTTLGMLRNADEVAIRTSANPDRPAIIWIVAVGAEVFARSFRGAGAKWYTASIGDGQATLELDDRRWPVGVTPVVDPAVIGQVSQAYLEKYAASPYAKEMVRGEILPTTLRLDPL